MRPSWQRDEIYATTDKAGKSFGEELERIGYRGELPARPKPVHAGPTPMEVRRDPFMAALPILQHCYDLAASFAPWGRATFGYIRAEPGYSHMEMVSGAGHDSLYLAKVAPTSMIFVPCEGGISHNEAENARQEDLEAGCNVLLQAMLKMAG